MVRERDPLPAAPAAKTRGTLWEGKVAERRSTPALVVSGSTRRAGISLRASPAVEEQAEDRGQRIQLSEGGFHRSEHGRTLGQATVSWAARAALVAEQKQGAAVGAGTAGEAQARGIAAGEPKLRRSADGKARFQVLPVLIRHGLRQAAG